MDHLTVGLQGVLSVLPLGPWLAISPGGIIYGTLLLDMFSCAILILSKFLFKEYFSATMRRNLFLIFVGGTAALLCVCYLFVTVERFYSGFLLGGAGQDYSFMLRYYYGLALIAYAFFIRYLIDIIIRLIRWFKRKRGGKVPVA